MSARSDRPATDAVYLSAGPAAAIALGIALIPLRGVTPVSNFAFAFIILTIVVAEYGGRAAALATAVVSALSLNFFLTPPYLRLTIHSPHDIVAFVGLAVCALTAAALGARRGERVEVLEAARRHRDFLRAALKGIDPDASVESKLTAVLRGAREALPLEAAVVRDAAGEVVASAAPADTSRTEPEEQVPPDASPGSGHGGRIPLRSERGLLGTLDVWGTAPPDDEDAHRMLSDLARLSALLLAEAAPRAAGGAAETAAP